MRIAALALGVLTMLGPSLAAAQPLSVAIQSMLKETLNIDTSLATSKLSRCT